MGGSEERPVLVVDAVGGEALEQAAVGLQHANRGILCPDDFRSYLHHALEHPFQRHLGDERGCRQHQALHPLGVGEARQGRGLRHA